MKKKLQNQFFVCTKYPHIFLRSIKHCNKISNEWWLDKWVAFILIYRRVKWYGYGSIFPLMTNVYVICTVYALYFSCKWWAVTCRGWVDAVILVPLIKGLSLLSLSISRFNCEWDQSKNVELQLHLFDNFDI